jgi:hypothetical protein
MLPFGVTIPATVPQGSEIPEELMNNPVFMFCPNGKQIFGQYYSGIPRLTLGLHSRKSRRTAENTGRSIYSHNNHLK